MNLFPDSTLLIVAVLFLINYWIVRTFFLKPINGILIDRETEIASAQRLYEEALSRFNEATSGIEVRLQEARREGSHVREARRSQAVSLRNSLIERTRSESERIAADAAARLDADVRAAREKIVGESEALAAYAAERILGRKVS